MTDPQPPLPASQQRIVELRRELASTPAWFTRNYQAEAELRHLEQQVRP